MFVLTVFFVSLGMWQSNRATEKTHTELQHQKADRVSFESALSGEQRFARIDVSGHYDPVRHILLDNQIWNGHAGVHVFTPFYTLSGTVILVNRGWLPLAANRLNLPEIPTPQYETVLRGMLNTLPVPGRMLGDADKMQPGQWPQLVTYLNLENISQTLQKPLVNWVVQLTDSEPNGFEGRDWKPVFLTSRKHKAYAFQWFAFASVSIVLWVFSSFRRPKENHS
jgi:surfeit locus 1 family protein